MLAGLDPKLADIVKNQAELVSGMQLGFGVDKAILMYAFGVELGLRCEASMAVANGFALAASSAGINIAVGMLTALKICAANNAARAGALSDQYLGACMPSH
jgi:hypothetical protein